MLTPISHSSDGYVEGDTRCAEGCDLVLTRVPSMSQVHGSFLTQLTLINLLQLAVLAATPHDLGMMEECSNTDKNRRDT